MKKISLTEFDAEQFKNNDDNLPYWIKAIIELTI